MLCSLNFCIYFYYSGEVSWYIILFGYYAISSITHEPLTKASFRSSTFSDFAIIIPGNFSSLTLLKTTGSLGNFNLSASYSLALSLRSLSYPPKFACVWALSSILPLSNCFLTNLLSSKLTFSPKSLISILIFFYSFFSVIL